MCYSALIKKEMKELPELFDPRFIKQWNAVSGFSDTKSNPFTGKPFKSMDEDGRFFPHYLTKIAFIENGHLKVGPAVYSAWLPDGLDPHKYTSYNARRDNITSKFWSSCFGKHHGFIVLAGFSEWVEVKDLLQAGKISAEEVASKFSSLIEARKNRVLASGKKYTLTKVERTDARFRKIIIDFAPDNEQIFVPVVYNTAKGIKGFAILTDDPLPEVAAAGHDRTPIMLTKEAIWDWIHPEGKSIPELLAILERRANTRFG